MHGLVHVGEQEHWFLPLKQSLRVEFIALILTQSSLFHIKKTVLIKKKIELMNDLISSYRRVEAERLLVTFLLATQYSDFNLSVYKTYVSKHAV